MKTHIAQIQGEKLLALSGLCMFAGAFFVYVLLTLPFDADEPRTDDPFVLGEYYFNHDDDAGGPYDLEKARFYYSKALKENPEAHELAWYQLGRIDFIEGRFTSALYKFDKQIEYFGDSVPNVHYMIGLTNGFLAQQTGKEEDWRKAEEGFKSYLLLDPESPWAKVDLSWVYFSQGRFEDMIPVLQEGLDGNPDHPWLLNMYGLALLNTGRKDEAYAAFVKAEAAADELTISDWGNAYPGNDPRYWNAGLESFKEAIRKNKALAES